MPKKPVQKTSKNTNPDYFIGAFQKRFGYTPVEYINKKLKTDSQLDAIERLFNIIAAEISTRNNCKYFDFNYFYKAKATHIPTTPKHYPSHKRNIPENAGRFWTTEEEQLLIKMFNSNATKKEICDAFKRTEGGLAARLVKLGIIEDRDVFRNRK